MTAIKKWAILPSLVVVAMLLSVVGAGAASSSPGEAAHPTSDGEQLPFEDEPPVRELPTPASMTEEEALAQDASTFAKDFDRDIKFAYSYFAAQDEAGHLEEELRKQAGEAFGGLYMQVGETSPEIVVLVVESAPTADQVKAIAQSRMERTDGELLFVSATRPISEVEATLVTLRTSLTEAGLIDVGTDFDIRSQRLVAAVDDASKVESASLAVRSVQSSSGIDVDVEVRGSRTVAEARGGLQGSNGCTTGYVGSRTYEYGLTTAAHCGNTMSTNGKLVPYRVGANSNNSDQQFHSSQGLLTPVNKFHSGDTATRSVTGTRHRNNQAVGSYVCKYGKTVGYKCGNTTTKWWSPSNSHNNVFTLVHKDNTYMTDHGDSGGPVFLGFTAWGLITHRTDCGPTCSWADMGYQAINYTSDIGVTVLTSAATDIQLLLNPNLSGVGNWNRLNSSMNWALYSGGPGGANRLEFNCNNGPTPCSVYSDRVIPTNGGSTYRGTVSLYCNASTACSITFAIWGLGGAANQNGSVTVSVAPYTWENVQKYVTFGIPHSSLRFEVYNNSPTKNIDISIPRLYTDQ